MHAGHDATDVAVTAAAVVDEDVTDEDGIR